MLPVAVVALVLVAGVAVVLGLRVRVLTRRVEHLDEVEQARAEAGRRAATATATAERLTRALDAIPQGVVVVDDQGQGRARNRAAREVVAARPSGALIGGAVDEALAATRRGEEVARTLELFGPPRRVVTVTARALPGGALVVIDDVTEVRRVDAMRRDFIANLSHELRTPVGAIGLLAETLLAETDPEVAHRLAERVVDESFRVSRTIDDLLELSRIEAGADAVREPVAVHLVLEEAVARLRSAAEQRAIAIRVAEVPGEVHALGDRRQLVSAVANLLDNAVKYSEPSSPIDVVARVDGDRVAIEVRDRGPGIPHADLERVFERFYRVDRARSRATGGTGLGLAIVRHVVANHRGEVTVRSVEGEGSTFTLLLPTTIPEPRTLEATPPASPTAARDAVSGRTA